jgi:hypothetical protein
MGEMRGNSCQALSRAFSGARVAVLLVAAAGSANAQNNYSGVAPGSNVVPDGIATQPGGAALVTWPGFQMLADGGSRVFIQTSVEVKAELKREGNSWTVLLPGVSLPPGNARLPLDTSFFNTPVKSVRAKLHKPAGVLVQLDMRSQVAPTLHTERASTGYFFVSLDFPPGSYR